MFEFLCMEHTAVFHVYKNVLDLTWTQTCRGEHWIRLLEPNLGVATPKVIEAIIGPQVTGGRGRETFGEKLSSSIR